MPPRGAHGSKTTSSPKSTLKSKKKSEGMAAEIIHITKPGSDENIELGDPVPLVELDKINSVGRWKDIPPSDTPGLIVPAYAPDEETRAIGEVLETLQKQQPATVHHLSSNLSTTPGEAEYFEGGGLMRTVRESVKRQKMHSSPVSQPLTQVTPAGLISTYSRWLQSALAGKLPVNKVLTVQAIEVDPRTTQHHPQGQVHQLQLQHT